MFCNLGSPTSMNLSEPSPLWQICPWPWQHPKATVSSCLLCSWTHPPGNQSGGWSCWAPFCLRKLPVGLGRLSVVHVNRRSSFDGCCRSQLRHNPFCWKLDLRHAGGSSRSKNSRPFSWEGKKEGFFSFFSLFSSSSSGHPLAILGGDHKCPPCNNVRTQVPNASTRKL